MVRRFAVLQWRPLCWKHERQHGSKARNTPQKLALLNSDDLLLQLLQSPKTVLLRNETLDWRDWQPRRLYTVGSRRPWRMFTMGRLSKEWLVTSVSPLLCCPLMPAWLATCCYTPPICLLLIQSHKIGSTTIQEGKSLIWSSSLWNSFPPSVPSDVHQGCQCHQMASSLPTSQHHFHPSWLLSFCPPFQPTPCACICNL